MTAINLPWAQHWPQSERTQRAQRLTRARVLLSGKYRVSRSGHNSDIQKFVHNLFYLVETHLEKTAGEPHERSKR